MSCEAALDRQWAKAIVEAIRARIFERAGLWTAAARLTIPRVPLTACERIFLVGLLAEAQLAQVAMDMNDQTPCPAAPITNSLGPHSRLLVTPVEAAVRLIRERSSERLLRQGDIAEALGVSASKLSRQLKRRSGATFCTHLHRARLDAAESLLATTGIPVNRIALSVGYRRASDLNYYFRRRHHTSPGTWRRGH